MLLTDEEIRVVRHSATYPAPTKKDIYAVRVDWDEFSESLAKAQLKKVSEWGDEDCLDELHRGGKRCNCPGCWQSLLDEARE